MSWLLRPRLALFLTSGLGMATYCVAEASLALAMIALPIWAAAWPINLSGRGKPLPRFAIGALVAAATGHALLGVISGAENLVFVISRFLLWLQLIKLYDASQPRDHAQRLMMSLFLVLGAMLISSSLALGAMLALYMPLALWTVILHQMDAGRANDARDQNAPAEVLSPRAGRSLGTVWLGAGAAIIAVAVGVFLILPRGVGGEARAGWGGASANRTSGFSEEVNLGSAGLISESPTPVMDVVVRDSRGRNISSADRTFLLRGAVLDSYKNGHWRRSDAMRETRERLRVAAGQRVELSKPLDIAETYTVEINRHRRGDETLFALHRPISLTVDSDGVLRVGADGQLAFSADGALRYTVQSQSGAPGLRQAYPSPEDQAFQEGRVRRLAERIIQDAGLDYSDRQRSADQNQAILRAFRDHLHQNYRYTTQLRAASPGEDPVEMFLFRNKIGHCEYFASAMAGLARSVGIDARVVTGYMVVEFDQSTGRYTVRQSHAHAWIEAAPAPGQWRTYDPSPPNDLSLVHQPPQGLAAVARDVMDAVERWWATSVVGFSEAKRAELLGSEDPFGLAAFSQRLSRRSFAPARPGGPPLLAVALLRGLIAFGVTAGVGVALVRLAPRLAARLRWRLALFNPTNRREAKRRRQTTFLTKSLRRLRRAGLGKPPWRPPQLHAEAIARQDAIASDAFSRLVDLYYASRFGRRLLSQAELTEADVQLRRLDHRLTERRRSR